MAKRCQVEIPGVGQCEVEGEHELDGRGWPVHRNGPCSWNGKDPNEINVKVRPGAVITAVIGEVDGHFVIWHTRFGRAAAEMPVVVEPENPVTIRISADDGSGLTN